MTVDPKMGILMVKLVRTYIKDGILDFRQVALNIREAFGPGAAALDQHLEIAWEMLRKEKVSVKEALAARTVNDEDNAESRSVKEALAGRPQTFAVEDLQQAFDLTREQADAATKIMEAMGLGLPVIALIKGNAGDSGLLRPSMTPKSRIPIRDRMPGGQARLKQKVAVGTELILAALKKEHLAKRRMPPEMPSKTPSATPKSRLPTRAMRPGWQARLKRTLALIDERVAEAFSEQHLAKRPMPTRSARQTPPAAATERAEPARAHDTAPPPKEDTPEE
jgi:hypothetical protein